jgi:hypothetical protein
MPVEATMNPQFSVARLAAVYAGAAPGANTDIFTAVKFSPDATCARLTIALTTGSKVDVRVTNGTTAYSQHLFANADCTAGCVYTCAFGVRRFANNGTTLLTYSIRLQTDGIIQTLNLEEVIGPVI